MYQFTTVYVGGHILTRPMFMQGYFVFFLYLRLPECFRNVVLDENVQDIQRAQQLWSEAVSVSQAPAEDLAVLLSELAIEVREV